MTEKDPIRPEEGCFFCRRRAGREPEPEGGFLYEDEHFLVGHGFLGFDDAGTLLIEARRHVLDFSAMAEDEVASLARLLPRLYRALYGGLGADRVYLITTQARNPHFHAFLHPWWSTEDVRGVEFLARDRATGEDEFRRAAAALAPHVASLASSTG
jgi:diadenosine tetraphosphate (Ap4A) HIT family hydrolase